MFCAKSGRVAVHRPKLRTAAYAVCIACVGLIAANFPRVGSTLVVSQPIDGPDVIVSLASHEWERLPEAARQADHFRAAAVVLTLPVPATAFNCHDCINRVKRLQLAGVAPGRVQTIPVEGRGTYGEAVAVRRWMLSTGRRRLLIVTSPYHTRRSLATFVTVLTPLGATVGVMPAADSPARPGRWWLAPYDRAYVRYEWAARFYYALRFGIVSP
jgi:uncharacterized SAM-binding protein YcdF (DUF218 family)